MNKSYTLRNRLGIYELYRSRVRFVFPLWGYSPFGDNYDFYLYFEREMVLEEKKWGIRYRGQAKHEQYRSHQNVM